MTGKVFFSQLGNSGSGSPRVLKWLRFRNIASDPQIFYRQGLQSRILLSMWCFIFCFNILVGRETHHLLWPLGLQLHNSHFLGGFFLMFCSNPFLLSSHSLEAVLEQQRTSLFGLLKAALQLFDDEEDHITSWLFSRGSTVQFFNSTYHSGCFTSDP